MSLALYRILVGVGCCDLVGGGVGIPCLVRNEGRRGDMQAESARVNWRLTAF